MEHDPGRTWRFCRRVAASGALLWVALAWGYPLREPLPLLALAVTAAVAVYAETRAFYLPGYGALNFGEGLYFGATLAFGPVVGGGFTALTGLLADGLNRKRPEVLVFNLGWSLWTFGSAGLAARWAGYDPARPLAAASLPGLAAGLAGYAMVAGLLQALGQHYFERMPVRETLAFQLRLMRLAAPAVLCLGVLAGMLLQLAAWSVVFMIFPLEVFSAYARIRDLHQKLESAHRELQDAQARLVASERQAALGVMAAGVAHEINNPLASMATTAHLLRQSTGPEAAGPLDLLDRAIERCRTVTERMLVYSRPPGRSQARAELGEVVRDALAFLARSELRVTVEGDAAVACEPGALVQIVTNLLTNAADAGARRLRIHSRVEGDSVAVRVEDDGGGIPKPLQERIFEPFVTSKEPGRGTGLGLSIAAGLARSAGGSLELERTGPEGSCFLLRLPPART